MEKINFCYWTAGAKFSLLTICSIVDDPILFFCRQPILFDEARGQRLKIRHRHSYAPTSLSREE